MSDLAADHPGVNTHINYLNTNYHSDYESIIRPRLIESGIRHIRDNPGGGIVADRFRELAANGINLLLITWNTDRSTLDYVKSLNRDRRVVEYIEPANERDINMDGWINYMITIDSPVAATQDVVWAVDINPGQAAFNGQLADYELLIPENEESGDGEGVVTTYYLWMELN